MYLQAGDMSATMRDGELRDVIVGGERALEAVYLSIRGHDWVTVPATVVTVEPGAGPGVSTVTRVEHVDGTALARSTITVSVVGPTITLAVDCRAVRSFDARRIGWCLLHPIDLVGTDFIARTPTGDSTGSFAPRINPAPPATDLTGLTYRVGDTSTLSMTFTGELFEMEDHRNWADPGWKTYCTPLSRSRPLRIAEGDRIRQTVVLTAHHDRRDAGPGTHGRRHPPGSATGPDADVVITDVETTDVPTVALVLPADEGDLAPGSAAAAVVGWIRPPRLHLPLRDSDGWESRLSAAVNLSRVAGCELQISAIGTSAQWLDGLAAAIAAQPSPLICRVWPASPLTGVTEPGMVRALRAALRSRGSTIGVGGGSLLHFAELNRVQQPPSDTWDFVCFPVTAQAHHSDDPSIIESPRSHPYAVSDAATIGGGCPVVMSPTSLRSRLTPGTPPNSSDAPDARETTAFGAAWILASATLSRADEQGWLVDLRSPTPGRPDVEMLRRIAAERGRRLLSVSCDHRRVAVLAVRDRRGVARVLVASLVAESAALRVNGRPVRLDGYGSHHLEVPLAAPADGGKE